LDSVKPLVDLINEYHPEIADNDKYFLMEFALWGLASYNKLSKQRFNDGLEFMDLYGGYIDKL
jgi:magnesium chelatase subunit I